jgi:hypothetical protein
MVTTIRCAETIRTPSVIIVGNMGITDIVVEEDERGVL